MMLFMRIYLVIVNIAALILFGVDKSRAVHHRWRIPESTLFLSALIGGGIGAWVGMYLFHHKTRKWYFVVGIPAIVIVEAVLLRNLILE